MRNENNNDRIILVYPGKFGSAYPQIPLPLLYVASFLRKNGISCELWDMRTRDYKEIELEGVKCVGISCLTGSSIKYTLEISEYIKKRKPDIPVILGGVHPTILPEETLKCDYVDIIVKGEGEQTFVELSQAILSKSKIDAIKGISYKNNGKIFHNPQRDFLDLDSLPLSLPYDLLRIHDYPYVLGKHIEFQSSRGCPYNCGFCYNESFNQRRYRAKSALKVVDEIEWLNKNFGINSIYFVDDEFFIDMARVENICRELIKRKLTIKWGALSRVDRFCSLSEDLVNLIKKSGCRALSFACEYTSHKMLSFINKDININMVIEVVKKVKAADIASLFFFLCGVPGERPHDLTNSLKFIKFLKKLNPRIAFQFNRYVPYPGTQLYKTSIERGFLAPREFEQWQRHAYNSFVSVPWLSKNETEFLNNLATMSRFSVSEPPDVISSKIIKKLFKFLCLDVWLRVKTGFYKMMWEWAVIRRILQNIYAQHN
jgi:anaerobic magnesium-protoporphyrin IX monomethyl ester cyclase